MTKEIRYTGFAASPSGYDCPDGQLAASFNLINEDGAMRPLFPPAPVMRLSSDTTIAHIHAGTSYRHYITRRGDILGWIDDADIDPDTLCPRVINSLDTDFTVGVTGVSSLGNILLVNTISGIFYCRWSPSSGRYIPLGSRLPDIPLQFALSQSVMRHPFDIDIPVPEEVYPSVQAWLFGSGGAGHAVIHPGAMQSPEGKQFIQSLSNAIFGALNSYVAKSHDEKCLLHPFLVRYALRLYDGSHVCQSAPVLMLPNSSVPAVTWGGSMSEGNFKASAVIHYASCRLLFRCPAIDSYILPRWKEIITHIDVFISAPIYPYDQSGDIVTSRATASAAPLFSHSGQTARSNPAQDDTSSSTSDSASDSDYHRQFIPLSGQTRHTFPAGCEESLFSTPSSDSRFVIPSHPQSKTEDAISSCSLFYLAASIPLDEIEQTAHFLALPLDDVPLSDIVTRPTLADDFFSAASLHPMHIYPYNARVTVADIFRSVLSPSPLSIAAPYTAAARPPATSQEVSLYVRLESPEFSGWVTAPADYLFCADGADPSVSFPRWFFYPDPSAVELAVAMPGKWLRLPLSVHTTLNGAYWFRGLGSETPQFSSGQLPADIVATPSPWRHLPSRIGLSEVNNPFFFPVTGFNTVGNGRILGICSAAKALSQGQFGQFPLYAFTTEGVWAMEVSAQGTYSARQPITRDVCVNPDSITQIDSAVLFATDRGIMLISGSQSQCISDVLDSPDLFDFRNLHGLVGLCPQAVCPDSLFKAYIRDCRMAYDYVRQRIIVFNPGRNYAYVYSMKTKLWGIQECSLFSVLNSYPDALAMSKDDSENNIVDLSRTDAEVTRCMLLSRPLKLDSPDVLKTVTTVIQRGIFPSHAIDSAIYGTRDYVNWHLVSSSRSFSIRSLLGTPYKAFIILAVADMRNGNTLSGCSVQYTPRFTNRLR